MKNIAVIFGGRSVEHDISILTGLHAVKHIDNYRVHYVYLTRDNQMLAGDALADIEGYITGKQKVRHCHFACGCLYIKKRAVKIDAVLNCCHGGVGENGELAAYLAIAGVPITSSGYIAAADMQSKTRTREILTAAGFKQPKYAAVTSVNDTLSLDFPVIVKPDSLGSSIGITVAHNEAELRDALRLAFTLDKKVIVEQFLSDIREVNCSAMRVNGEIKISACEEINKKSEFFDFDSKYLDSGSGFIKKGKQDKPKKDHTEIQSLTKKAYELFNARGVIRADFIIAKGKIYLNEINTVPGFLAYHLWARAGVPYGVVIDGLVKQAVVDATSRSEQITIFKSEILAKNRGLLR